MHDFKSLCWKRCKIVATAENSKKFLALAVIFISLVKCHVTKACDSLNWHQRRQTCRVLRRDSRRLKECVPPPSPPPNKIIVLCAVRQRQMQLATPPPQIHWTSRGQFQEGLKHGFLNGRTRRRRRLWEHPFKRRLTKIYSRLALTWFYQTMQASMTLGDL